MHAVLCRQWRNRVKGRDWYDLVWYCSHHPRLNLEHLEQRMRQTGHWSGKVKLGHEELMLMLKERVATLNIQQARQEVSPFVRDQTILEVWSKEFFADVIERIDTV